MYLYPARLGNDTNGTILVTFPDVPEAITYGQDRAEAFVRAANALEAALSFYVDEGKPLPKAGRARGRNIVPVAVCALADLKLQLYESQRSPGIRKAELARRMGISRTNIDRLFDLTRSSRVEQLEAAFRALGKRLVIQVEDAT